MGSNANGIPVLSSSKSVGALETMNVFWIVFTSPIGLRIGLDFFLPFPLLICSARSCLHSARYCSSDNSVAFVWLPFNVPVSLMSLLFDCDLSTIRSSIATSRTLGRHHLRAEMLDMIGLGIIPGISALSRGCPDSTTEGFKPIQTPSR